MKLASLNGEKDIFRIQKDSISAKLPGISVRNINSMIEHRSLLNYSALLYIKKILSIFLLKANRNSFFEESLRQTS